MLRFRTLIPIVLIIVSVLIGLFYIKPLYAEIMNARDKKAQIEDALKKIEDIDNVISGLRSDINSIPDTDMNKINAILPYTIDEVRYLDMVDSLADTYNLPITGLSITGLDNDTDGNSSALPSDIKNNAGVGGIDTIEIQFSVSATYDVFKEFLRAIEKSLVLFDVSSISLTSAQSGLDDNGEDTYNYTVKLETYLKR